MGPKHSRCHNDDNCGKRECKNNRINSDTLIHCDSTLVRQDLCVDAIVGGEETGQPTVLQTDTVIFAAPADPITPPLRLMTVIAQNLSQNVVNVQIFEDQGETLLVEANANPNSEVALSAPGARLLQASAEAPSRVRFFITVFLPVDPILPGDPV